MVEYYPATVEIGVRFPDDAFLFYFFTFLFLTLLLKQRTVFAFAVWCVRMSVHCGGVDDSCCERLHCLTRARCEATCVFMRVCLC